MHDAFQGARGAFVGASGVNLHQPAVATKCGGGADRIAQAALFAHFGEEATAACAAQDSDGHAMGVGVGVPIRRGIETDGKVGLLGIKLHQMRSAQGGAGLNGVLSGAAPALKQAFHHVPGALGLNIASHADHRATRTGAPRPRGANFVLGERLQPSNGSVATAIKWSRHRKLAQAYAGKMLRLIFQSIQGLQRNGTHGFQGICVQVRLPNHQGK